MFVLLLVMKGHNLLYDRAQPSKPLKMGHLDKEWATFFQASWPATICHFGSTCKQPREVAHSLSKLLGPPLAIISRMILAFEGFNLGLEFSLNMNLHSKFFSPKEAFLKFNAKIRYYWRIVNSWVSMVMHSAMS